MSIGQNIKKARKNIEITQKELASRCKLSRSYVADLELDRYNPSIETLKIIAQNLQVKISFLLGEDQDTIGYHNDYNNLEVGHQKLTEIMRCVKELTEEDQETVLKVILAFNNSKKQINL